MAFSDFYDRYFSRLYHFALKKTGHEAAAKDLVQESLLKLWDKAQNIEEDKRIDVEAYLITIVRNACYDYHRKQKVRQSYRSQFYHQRREETHQDQHLWELVTKIDQVYNSMPDKTLDIFLLSRDNGLTYQEIADSVDLSVKAVEYHISKALEILREELQDYL